MSIPSDGIRSGSASGISVVGPAVPNETLTSHIDRIEQQQVDMDALARRIARHVYALVGDHEEVVAYEAADEKIDPSTLMGRLMAVGESNHSLIGLLSSLAASLDHRV